MNDLELIDDTLLIRRIVVGDLDTNCWMIADTTTREAVIVDPGDEPTRLLDATTDLHVRKIVLTHTHWDHVLAVAPLADHLGVPIRTHPADAPVWPDELQHLVTHGHFDAGTATDQLLACGCSLAPSPTTPTWNGEAAPLHHSDRLVLGDHAITALHTPGHTPGGISLHVRSHLFTGDTLFPGGPGLTGWAHSDFPTIINSIQRTLYRFPDTTAVHPGHGPSTTIGAERPALAEWIARGW